MTGLLSAYDCGLRVRGRLHLNFSVLLTVVGTIMRSLRRERGEIEGCDLTREILGMEQEGPTHRPAESFTILNEVVVDRGPNSSRHFSHVFEDGSQNC